jgi:hypothetical protein
MKIDIQSIRILFKNNKESALAEKIEAISKLGLATSRMKDFYDI